MSKALKIKNRYLVGLGSWLQEQQLSGRESRERTRFVTLLQEQLNDVDKHRNEILEKYVGKDDKGNWKTVVDNGKEKLDVPADQEEAFFKEIEDLMDEEFVLDLLEGNKQKIRTVKDILLNTDYKFGPREGDSAEEREARIRQAADYEKWCEAFEAIELK